MTLPVRPLAAIIASREPFKISIAKKEAGVYCCAYNCTNKPVYKKGGLCHKHYFRLRRKKKPIEIRFSQMKQKAKVRNIDFSLTLEEFMIFCKNTGYLTKGKRGHNATIDRRCNYQGYHFFNIQLLTLKENAAKGAKHSGDDFECPF